MNLLKRALAVFIASIFLINSLGVSACLGERVPASTLAPESIFSPLTNPEKRHIAILQYLVLTRIFSGSVDPLRENKDISITQDGVPVAFMFSDSLVDQERGISLVPCKYGDSRYWCLAKAISVKEGEGRLKYEITFYTEREMENTEKENILYRSDAGHRAEQMAIDRATRSEQEHDEVIRAAIALRNFLPIEVGKNQKSFSLIYAFLDIVSPGLSASLAKLSANDQVMIIIDPRLKEPHAGGMGIYLPDDEKFITAGTIVHETFAKAGFTHEESGTFENIFNDFVLYFTDGVVDPPGALPKNMPLSPVERKLLARAKTADFIDLTEKIDTRDYSSGKEPKTDKQAKGPKTDRQTKSHDTDRQTKSHDTDRFSSTDKPKTMTIRKHNQLQREAVQEIRAYLDTIVSSIPEAIFVKDADGRFVLANPAECELIGHTEEELLGNTDEDLYPKEQVAHFAANDRMVLDTGRESISEEKLTDAKGVTHTLVTKKTLYVDSKGRKFIVGISRDVTVERRKERERRYLARIIEGTSDLACIKDLELRVVTANAAFLKTVGKALQEVVGKTDEEIFAGLVDEATIRQYMKDDRLAQELKDGQQIEREENTISYDGRAMMIFTRKFPIFDSSGKLIATASISSNITERKMAEDARRQAETALRLSEQRYREIFSRSPIGIATCDQSGVFIDANSSFVKIFGISNDGLLRMKIFNFSKVMDELKGDLIKGKSIRFETKFDFDVASEMGMVTTRKGTAWLDYLVTATMDDQGAPSGFLLQVQDITEKKQAELKLQEAYSKLAEKTALLIQAGKLTAIGENTAALTHEINNPVSNIMFLIDQILKRLYEGAAVEKSEIEDALERTNREIDRIAGITDRFLGFARGAEAGKIPCYVEDILLETIDMRRAMMTSMGIKVNCDLGDSPSVVIADKNKIKQVFLNLIMNAVQAMKSTEKKDLNIFVKRSALASGRQTVVVTIEDTGCGISHEDLSHIWEKFYTKRTDGTGTGLGLAVVAEVMKEHDSKASVESALGHGSKFTIEMPLSDDLREDLHRYGARAAENIYGSFLHDFSNNLAFISFIESLESSPSGGQISAILNTYKEPLDTLFKTFKEERDRIPLDVNSRFMIEAAELLGRIRPIVKDLTEKLQGNEKALKNVEKIETLINRAEDCIENARGMISIANVSKKYPAEIVNVPLAIKSVTDLFAGSKRFFPANDVTLENLKTVARLDKDLAIMACSDTFKFAMYDILLTGLSFGQEERSRASDAVIKLEPQHKKVSISVELNRRSGEVVITVKMNYFMFTDNDLKLVDVSDGEKVARILQFDSDLSTPLAAATAALRSVAGRITISNEGAGAAIRVFLPGARSAIEAVAAREEAAAAKEETTTHAKKIDDEFVVKAKPGLPNIVFVDDEPIQRQMIGFLLKSDQFNVWFAKNGQEGLELVNKLQDSGVEIDLAILDVTMPPANGSDILDGSILVKRIRARGYKFPILMHTGHGAGDPIMLTLEKNGIISGIISKTIRPAEKMAQIMQILEASASRSTKAADLQRISINKKALVYGPDFAKGVQALKSVGFSGDILSARNEAEFDSILRSGEKFDMIINTTTEDMKELIYKTIPDLATLPEIINDIKDKHKLQSELFRICA